MALAECDDVIFFNPIADVNGTLLTNDLEIPDTRDCPCSALIILVYANEAIMTKMKNNYFLFTSLTI